MFTSNKELSSYWRCTRCIREQELRRLRGLFHFWEAFQFSNQISSFYSVTPALIYFSSLLSPISTQGAEELDLAVLIRQEASVVLICSFCLTVEFWSPNLRAQPYTSSDWNRTISGPAPRRRNIAYRHLYGSWSLSSFNWTLLREPTQCCLGQYIITLWPDQWFYPSL